MDLFLMNQMIKTHPILKLINGSLRDLPSPSSLNSIWNFGSLLGLCLRIQIFRGVFLAIHFSADSIISFFRVNHIERDVNIGWILRIIHANGASAFFICIYLHMARGVYFRSFKLQETWILGVVILLIVMGAAFIGYVLPWGQISFWGATVITNLLSAVPIVGPDAVIWLWGGFAVDNATLTRFFTFHFIIPFLVVVLVLLHLLFLHQSGSSNPLGLEINRDKSPFHPYFSWKDLLGVLVLFSLIWTVVGLFPWALGDPENFISANPLVTPVHIQPEWYFLFAYAILRSIPNKLGGVVALGLSVLIYIFLPFFPLNHFQSSYFYPLNKLLIWSFFSTVVLLTWIGARPVEEPYITTGQILTIVYFRFFGLLPIISKFWDLVKFHQ